jgi:hypothetical protein
MNRFSFVFCGTEARDTGTNVPDKVRGTDNTAALC